MSSTPQPIRVAIGASATDLYTAFVDSAATRSQLVSLNLSNTTAAAITVDVWYRNAGDTTSTYLIQALSVPAHSTKEWRGLVVLNTVGEKLRAQGSATGVDCLGSLIENIYGPPSSGSSHDPLTLATAAEAVFDLSAQVFDFDATQANKVLAGPTAGGDAKPAMRLLVAADIPGGAAGVGPQGPPGFDGMAGEDAFPIPGPPGTAGAAGAGGRMGMPGFDGVDGVDGVPIPGPQGAAGAAGAVGAAGVGAMGPPGMDGDGIVDYGLLGIPSSLLHTRYTDAEAVAAVEAETPLDVYNELMVGVPVTRHGIITLAGHGAGNPDGAEFYMGLSADYDSAFSSYFFNVYEDDLYLNQDGANVLLVKADRSIEIPTGPLNVNHINEYTAAHGVEIDGVLLKDDAVETDAIRGLRETTGPTSLAMGAVADGEYLKRSGATIIGGAGGAGVDIVTVWAYGD